MSHRREQSTFLTGRPTARTGLPILLNAFHQRQPTWKRTPMTIPSSVLLSVVIPTYNRSGFVRKCLSSLQQSQVPDLEVIVSDDGSTDDTKAVVAEMNPSAVYLWQPNSGTPATARNRGFAVSRGRYVAFLDCDDQWLPGAPSKAIALLDKHPEVNVLFGDVQAGNPTRADFSGVLDAGQGRVHELPHREPESGFLNFDRSAFFRRMVERNLVFISACVMRREAFG